MADIRSHGKIYLVFIFCIFLSDSYMCGDGLAEIIHDDLCVYFLFYIFRLFLMKTGKPDGVFQLSE